MKEKKLIIFDMDGTLVDSSLTIANAINFVRSNLGLSEMPSDNILKKVNDHTINPSIYFYNAAKFIPQHEKWFNEYYTNNHKKELRLYDGVERLLEKLKQNDYALAIATNAYRVSALESLNFLDIMSYFNSIACYDDVKAGKPAPDMLYKVLDELNISKKESLFIGDGERDEEASLRAKIDYIMVNWGFSDHKKTALSSIDEIEKIFF
jgi:phosphoglycolate phosphatase